MKKILLFALLLMFSIGCSSDDNKGGDQTDTENGSSTAVQIKTPDWLHGNWQAKEASEFTTQGFTIKRNDLCVVVVTASSCYQSQINAINKVDAGSVKLVQEYKNNAYYKLEMTLLGVTTTYVFTKKGNDEIEIEINDLASTFVRK